jgi:hypothetical protein
MLGGLGGKIAFVFPAYGRIPFGTGQRSAGSPVVLQKGTLSARPDFYASAP